ncbi:putative methyltransferase domain-containing protein [Rosellinia necatrix]|uniref:Putative methyltransferase domain-containing protein n=1 Tax=Rosellinia necatrix TaxID=77044 RepID=A0A1W2TBC2_ROSNE|nr:putative methyltransferase domain-containing protein [Rosellinia necatrix]
MSSAVYNLNHDWDNEVKRLRIQHDFFRDLAGGELPAPVWAHVKGLEAPKIADVGTGTGIWATELSQKLPETAVIDGYDIDVIKFPDPTTLPRNVKLQFADIFKPFPPEATGKYDVVHVRFLIFALKKDEWLLAVKNLKKLLAPGGFLFWQETGPYSWSSSPWSEPYFQWVKLESEVGILLGRDPLAPVRLPSQFKEAGLAGVEEKIFAMLRQSSMTPVDEQPGLLIMAQSLTGLVENGTLKGRYTKEDVRKLVEAARVDVQNGTAISANFHWTWGQNII